MQQSDTLFPPSINLAGQLVTFSEPQVMGILNVTPDSFYAASHTTDAEAFCTCALAGCGGGSPAPEADPLGGGADSVAASVVITADSTWAGVDDYTF